MGKRETWYPEGQRWLYLVGLGIAFLSVVRLVDVLSHAPFSGWERVHLIAAVLAAACGLGLARSFRRHRVQTDEEGLRLFTGWRPRRIMWDDIEDIRRDKPPPEGGNLVVVLRDGATVDLQIQAWHEGFRSRCDEALASRRQDDADTETPAS